MIAVTFALPTESSKFSRLLNARAISASDVRVVHTGVGETACTRSIGQFLATHSPRLLISSGFAGALTSDLKAADLVLAQNYTSPEWLERCRRAIGEHARVGPVATASVVADTVDERARLAARTGAIAVDMETQFIAEACRAASIPMIALRVISDTADAPLPAPPHVLFDLDRQKTNAAAIALHIARHPTALLRLIGFARQVAITRERLTNALAKVVQDVRSAP